jgi:alpha-glucosidase
MNILISKRLLFAQKRPLGAVQNVVNVVFAAFFFCCVAMNNAHLFAQSRLSQSLGECRSWRSESNGLSLVTDQAHVRIVAYSPSILRVRAAKTLAEANNQPAWDDHSFAVVAAPQAQTRFTVADAGEAITLETDVLRLVVRKNPVRLQFFTKSGDLLNEDEPAFGMAWIGDEAAAYKTLMPNERFIGLGEKTGGLNKFGNGYTHWNTDAFGYGAGSDPLYGSTPFYMGLHNGAPAKNGKNLVYGIFLDNSYKSHFNFGASNRRFSGFTVEGGELNYYFIHRPSVGEIVQDYTALTGRMELPPLWSLGYHQCRYSYFPDTEVLNVARTMREKKIPGDVLWFDIHYMDAYKVFTWHPERFPRPKEMLAALDSMGFRAVVITDPGIKVEKGYHAYDDGVKNDVFLKYPDGTPHTSEVWPGWCHFPDFTKESARRWWGDYLKPLVEDGIDGFWTDMNEPATWGQRFPDLVEFDFDGNKATHKKGHNVYGLEMARATFEGAKKHLNGKRPFNLTRAFYSGVQRYSAVWTGDNTASDEHLLLGAELVANLGLAGVPFAGVDVGGFNGNGSRELFARWVTLGAFTPFFRVHAAINTKEQDPWSFGEDVEEISKAYIGFRYQLMPYLYSAFYESVQTGLPVARSLAFAHAFDDAIYRREFSAEYMFGPSLLIAPVKSSDAFAKIYLPEGEWHDLHTGARYAGKRTVVVETPLERLPVFVKGGQILCMQSVVQSAKERPSEVLTVRLYAGAQGSEFVYYEDDGESYGYEKGEYFRRNIAFDPQAKTLKFSAVEGKRASKFTQIRLVFHGFDAVPKDITLNGKKLNAADERSPILSIRGGFDPLGGDAVRGSNSQATFPQAVQFDNAAETLTVRWR